MAFLFAHARGAVKLVEGPWHGPALLRLAVQDMRRDMPATKMIVTHFALRQQGNYQFVHTLADRVFVYVFGDRISELLISGIAFGNPCDGDGRSGVEHALQAYQKHKLSLTGRPVVVALGSFRFQSFLTGMKMEMADSATQLAQVSYIFNCFPQG